MLGEQATSGSDRDPPYRQVDVDVVDADRLKFVVAHEHRLQAARVEAEDAEAHVTRRVCNERDGCLVKDGWQCLVGSAGNTLTLRLASW